MSLLLAVLLQAHVELGPMVGHAGPDSVLVWVKASGPSRFAVQVGEREDLSDGREGEGVGLADAAAFMGAARVGGLKPATRYHYAVLLDGKPALARPYPSFVTAPEAGARGRVRFAFISCVGKFGLDAAAGWADMAARTKFDLLLLLGDNHYADTADPIKQRAAYAGHRSVAGWADLARRTPTYAVWDDHDYGPNNSDGTLKGKEDSLRTFREHWANPTYGEEENPGVYFSFLRGDVEFFMLDSRYHRTPNKTPEDGKKTMLGPRQLAWLKERLAASRATVKVLAGGSEWQTNTTDDCWRSFIRERNEIFAHIEEKGVKGVILLSGDRHFTAAYQVAGRFIEVTSGPLGSKNAPSKNLPEMFMNHPDGKLYTIFDIDTSADTPAVTLEIYRAAQGLVEKRPFTWDEINGITKIPSLPPTAPLKK